MIWLAATLVIVAICAIIYWQLVITEGTYLGPRLVALLYDWTAERYNDIKEFNDEDEDFCLGRPLASRLAAQPTAPILDVATGTGRIPLLMMRRPGFRGKIVGVDRSSKMLNVARRDTARFEGRVYFVQADAMALPFATGSVPTVSCMEALEFLPSPQKGVKELVRVLQPATRHQPGQGWLMTTNRVGWEARLMPGKTWHRHQLEAILSELPLRAIDVQVWQDIYDLVWAQKVAD